MVIQKIQTCPFDAIDNWQTCVPWILVDRAVKVGIVPKKGLASFGSNFNATFDKTSTTTSFVLFIYFEKKKNKKENISEINIFTS